MIDCTHNLKHTQMYFNPTAIIVTYCADCGKRLSKVDVREKSDFVCFQNDIRYNYK